MNQFQTTERRLLIGGEWVSGKGPLLEVIDPATEEPFASVETASVEQVSIAVDLAHDAQRLLRAASGRERGTWLQGLAARLADSKESIAALEARNIGKPLAEAYLDVDDAVGCLLYYADLATSLDAEENVVIANPSPDFEIRLRHDPVGVSALVIPWNFPLLTTAWKLGPAMAAGCASIIKPSEFTPLSALALAALTRNCGLPAGTITVLNGDGAGVGEPLCQHPRVSKISFTGSTETGRKVGAIAAMGYKRLTVEAGGKSPIIVFADVPVESAIEWIMYGALYNQGEVCNATTRVLIEESAYRTIIDRLVQEVSLLSIGPSDQSGVQMGPLQNRPQFEKFLRYVKLGQEQGGRLLCGGDRHPSYSRGFYVRPALFDSVSTSSAIWCEEVFGPLLAFRPFRSEAEAIAVANDSEYGLAGAVLTADPVRADRIAAALEVGCVWQQCSGPAFVQGPWGGFKRSGFGRELGRWGLESFREAKQVTRYTSAKPWGWYLK